MKEKTTDRRAARRSVTEQLHQRGKVLQLCSGTITHVFTVTPQIKLSDKKKALNHLLGHIPQMGHING